MREVSPLFPASRARVQSLPASQIREVANAAMGRADVLAFWFGESDQPTPEFIRRAAMASLEQGETFYTPNLGQPGLRQAIATYLTGLHGKSFTVERIGVTGSGVNALMLANQLLVEPGDRVVAVTPLWPNIVEIPRILGGEVIRVPLGVDGGRWRLDLDRLLAALTPDTRLLLLNSPSNPTGWTIDAGDQRVVLDHCRRHGIWILADDVYERLVYREGLASAPSFLAMGEAGDRIIGVNSFSKAWSMTGWRAGWLVVPPSLLADLAKLIEFNTSCVPDFVQRAATVAITQGDGYITALRADLAAKRELVVGALKSLPEIDLPEADGAMYAFFRVAGQTDSVALAKRLVAEAGLGLAPGRAFGPEGEGWLRWCYAADSARLREGVARLARALGHG
ncbi:pyridoxal phosphate-dependent aminotransferase [Oleomonas cavernae]|uniref:Aminotransferase n=1 Tax=Oleomonas cavernae TaxID=2320859 RepID=A0A418WAH3_9PROT|nr:pyridoxal phosphate-dependent aminotransferase [Oleomonas cavernae]RJF86954.1 pyridoxal phosphate-dependent aminotransferase [Oleomonas cavernae]